MPTARAAACPASQYHRAAEVPVPAGVAGQLFGIRAAVIAAGLISASCFWPLLRSPLRRTLTPQDAALEPAASPGDS